MAVSKNVSDQASSEIETQRGPTLADVIRHWSRRSWAICGLVMGLVLALVVVLALLGTGVLAFNRDGLVSLDSKLASKRIATELQDQKISAVVECPETIVAPVGFSFICMVNTPEGNVARVQVTIKNIIGDIFWNLTTDLPQNVP